IRLWRSKSITDPMQSGLTMRAGRTVIHRLITVADSPVRWPFENPVAWNAYECCCELPFHALSGLTFALTGARPMSSDMQTERRPGVQCRAQVRPRESYRESCVLEGWRDQTNDGGVCNLECIGACRSPSSDPLLQSS